MNYIDTWDMPAPESGPAMPTHVHVHALNAWAALMPRGCLPASWIDYEDYHDRNFWIEQFEAVGYEGHDPDYVPVAPVRTCNPAAR